MFEAKLDKGVILKKLLEAIKELVDDANLDCSSKGISLEALDTSHVSLVNLLLKGSGFQKFRCDRKVSLGINLKHITTILKISGGDDSITLEAEEDGDTLNFTFENQDKDRYSKFSMKLVDIETEPLGISDAEYSANVSMPSNQFLKICRDMSAIGDTITISATKEGVKFSVDGDIGSGSMTVKQNSSADADEDNSVTIKLKEPVNLSFGLSYLLKFAKSATLSNTVILSLSKDSPLVVEYKLEDGLGFMRYYLAPKIEDEEEEDEDDDDEDEEEEDKKNIVKKEE